MICRAVPSPVTLGDLGGQIVDSRSQVYTSVFRRPGRLSLPCVDCWQPRAARYVRHNLSSALKSGWRWRIDGRASVCLVGHRARNHLCYSEVVGRAQQARRRCGAVQCDEKEWVTDELRKRSVQRLRRRRRAELAFVEDVYNLCLTAACHDVTACFCVRAVFRRRLTRWRT